MFDGKRRLFVTGAFFFCLPPSFVTFLMQSMVRWPAPSVLEFYICWLYPVSLWLSTGSVAVCSGDVACVCIQGLKGINAEWGGWTDAGLQAGVAWLKPLFCASCGAGFTTWPLG